MYRLAELDADSAGLVRVIDYFDTLVRHGADAAAVVRAGAALAGCTAGVDISGRAGWPAIRLRCDQHGRRSPEPVGTPTVCRAIVVDGEVAGTAWIERGGATLALDEMLVDRMALTTAIVLHPAQAPTSAEHTRALLVPAGEAAMLASCGALGLTPDTQVRVVVTAADSAGRGAGATAGRSVPVVLDGDLVRLAPAQIACPPDSAGRVGVSLAGPVSAAHRYLDEARFARSQATATEPVVRADELGALVLLGSADPTLRQRIPDLIRADALAAEESGRDLLQTLRVYLAAGTLRAAAETLHLHHSSVGHRLARLSDQLGFPVDSVAGRARAAALVMVLNTMP